MRRALDLVVLSLSLSLLTPATPAHAQRAGRTQSSVILKPSARTAALGKALPRPDTTPPPSTTVTPTRPDRTSPLVVAVTAGARVRPTAVRTDTTRAPAPTPAPPPTRIVTPQQAARQLASGLYGASAQPASIRVLNPRTASVWVGETAVKEKAPPGLGAAEGIALPFRFVRVDSAGGDTLALKPWLDKGNGLRYDARRRAFVATITIGLRDTLHAGRGRTLTPPIRLSVAASADTIRPKLLEITETNVFQTTVELVALRFDTLMRVQIWPDFSPREVSLWLAFQRDTLVLEGPNSTSRFGLGQVQLAVSAPTGAIPPGDSVAVTIQSERGTDVTYIRDGVPSFVRIPSTERARDTFTASAPRFSQAKWTVAYAFPFALLGGAVLGALLGAGLNMLRERGRPDTPAAVWVILSGLLAGVIVALVVALGVVRIPGFALPEGGSAAVSLLAGTLGGYVGPKGIEALFSAFGAGRASKPAA